MRRFGITLLVLLMAGQALGAVRATLDAPQTGVGEPVQLTLSYDGQTREQPDLTPLQQDFDILSSSRSNNMSIINGSVSSHTEVHLMIAPKRAGQLLVPQVTWGGELSNPVTLLVGAGAAPPRQNVFLEEIVDTHEPYVQAAVNVTVRVYAGERLLQAGLEFTGNGDVLVQQVGTDRNRQLEKNGQLYDVVERHYVLFPQKAGEIRLTGAQLSGQVVVRLHPDRLTTDPFADLFGAAGMAAGTKPIRIHGDDIVLNVKPSPSGIDPHAWLPARRVTLTEQWHPDGAEIHVGDPITRDLHLKAEGVNAAQLPDVSALMTLPPGVKAYPDQPKLDNAVQGDVVVATRDQSVAMIADHAGTVLLPAVKLTWWDTAGNEAREVTLPARTVKVLPAVGGPPASAAAPGSADTPVTEADASANTGGALATATGNSRVRAGTLRDPWVWSTLAFAVLWIGTVVAWLVTRQRSRGTAAGAAKNRGPKQAPLTPAQARARFQAACRQDDPHAARHALLAWAEVAWPLAPPTGLEALAKRVGDPRVEALLVELDRALYRGAPWNGAPLAAALPQLPPKGDAGGDGEGDGGGLAPLYR